jgi:hypothetical protein
MVRLTTDPRRWHSSDSGLVWYGIERDGWVRTTVELPPGTKAEQIAEIGFLCGRPDPKKRNGGPCILEGVSRAFFLGQPSFWKLANPQPMEIPPGALQTFPVF